MFEMTQRMLKIKDQQGWNENAILSIALQFIAKNGQTAAFEECLQLAANEEQLDHTMFIGFRGF